MNGKPVEIPSLDALVANPGMATTLTSEVAQTMLIELACLQPVLLQRALMGPHMQELDSGALLTPAQVAERLNVPKSFVYEAARQKQLEPVKVGKKYIRFTAAAVKDYQAKYVDRQ